jgi:thiol-activated cytolysin
MRLLPWLALLAACTTTVDTPIDNANNIDDYIASLPYLPVDPVEITAGQNSPEAREGDYQCTTQNLRETRQYDRIVAYAANSDSLYPGAIVGADSVLSGLFTQIVLPRAPSTISVSLENLEGAKSAELAEPSLSTYREALAGILDTQITGSTPANLYSEIEEVHSETQLDMALGVQASWGLGVASLKTSFDWSKQEVRSRHVVRYTQAYYTVDLDAPESPSALLRSDVTLDEVKEKMDAQRPPVYVSSVTYGRMVVFTFESEYSAEEMGAALEFAYSGGIDVSGDISVTYKDIISRSKITAFILGGSAGEAVKTIDSYEALVAFIKQGGNYSKDSPGAPIAYKLNYLKDNSPARMSFTTDYDLKECVRIAQRIRVVLNSIAVEDDGGDAGNDLELYGQIWAEGTNTGMLFQKNDNNYVVIREGSIFGTPISETIIDVAPRSGEQIRLRGQLTDHDPFADDEIGNEIVLNPFETGWRKEVSMIMTGSDARVRINFSLSPI